MNCWLERGFPGFPLAPVSSVAAVAIGPHRSMGYGCVGRVLWHLEGSMSLGVVLAEVATEISYSALPEGMVPQKLLTLSREAEALVGAFSFSESFHGAS